MRYLDPTNDLVFKKLFGSPSNKNILMSFLNAVLDRRQDEQIVDIVFNDPYNHLPSIDHKLSIVDVRCTDERGYQYIVELQVDSQADYLERCQYYAATAISRQLQKKEAYGKVMPIYFIGITDFILFRDHKRYYSSYSLTDTYDRTCRLHLLNFYFIELKKFNKALDELNNDLDKWIFFLNNAPDCIKPPKELKQLKSVDEAFDVLEQSGWTPQELAAYEKIIDAARVERSVLQTAKDEGRAEGRIEIARQMLTKGLDIDLIAQITGLCIEEIKKL